MYLSKELTVSCCLMLEQSLVIVLAMVSPGLCRHAHSEPG